MKRIVTICLCLITWVSIAQEQETYKAISTQFKALYNAGDYEAIFNRFAPRMQKALPLEKTVSTFTGVKQHLGAIVDIAFNRLKDEGHVYKVTFESEELRDIRFSLDKNQQLIGLLISTHKPNDIPVIARNTTKMILPFKGEWFVFWGGTDVKQNYHVAYEDQQFAYDILMVKNGKSYDGDPEKNESYFAFGAPIIAPCDATVVKVITGVKDNVPGELNPAQLTGNTVVLETAHKEYLLFAHLKQGSVAVKEGQKVKQGELLGACGNSGNSTETHLHLSLQNHKEMAKSIGGKLFFDKILVNGSVKEDYMPIKEDFIKNINE